MRFVFCNNYEYSEYFIEAYQWDSSLILANLEWKKNNRQSYSTPQDAINLTHGQSLSALNSHSQCVDGRFKTNVSSQEDP